MMEVRLRAEAFADLEAACSYYSQIRPDLALQFLDVFESMVELLGANPQLGHVIRSDRPELASVRQLVLSKPFQRYVVFYVIGIECISVLKIIHGSQDLLSLLLPSDS